MEGLSASDVALMQKDSCNGWGDNGFMWIFALLILAGGGFGGWNNQNASALSQADLQRAIDLNSIQNGQRDIEARVQEIAGELTTTIKDSAYNNLSELRDLQSAINLGFANQQNCCCNILRSIDSVNYNIATTSAANTQKILDAIAGNRMADMQNQINQLQLMNAMAGVVRYPSATTYTSGINPFCGCNCNN